MKLVYRFLLMTAALFVAFPAAAQSTNKADSLEICKTMTNFFGWYIDAIKQNKQLDFQPEFVKSKNGMTTLSFDRYFANLQKMGVSDSMLSKTKALYKACIDNLEKIDYKTFTKNTTDLDDFEKIDCSFSNQYMWIGGQEPIDGIRIIGVGIDDGNTAIVLIGYFNYSSDGHTKHFFGRNKLTLVKMIGLWKIDSMTVH